MAALDCQAAVRRSPQRKPRIIRYGAGLPGFPLPQRCGDGCDFVDQFPAGRGFRRSYLKRKSAPRSGVSRRLTVLPGFGSGFFRGRLSRLLHNRIRLGFPFFVKQACATWRTSASAVSSFPKEGLVSPNFSSQSAVSDFRLAMHASRLFSKPA